MGIIGNKMNKNESDNMGQTDDDELEKLADQIIEEFSKKDDEDIDYFIPPVIDKVQHQDLKKTEDTTDSLEDDELEKLADEIIAELSYKNQ